MLLQFVTNIIKGWGEYDDELDEEGNVANDDNDDDDMILLLKMVRRRWKKIMYHYMGVMKASIERNRQVQDFNRCVVSLIYKSTMGFF